MLLHMSDLSKIEHSRGATLARNVCSNLETRENISKPYRCLERERETYVAVTVFVIFDVVVVRFVIVRVDVPAVSVTVVFVAAIVTGAGVIVVVFSTVARRHCQLFALDAIRSDENLLYAV